MLRRHEINDQDWERIKDMLPAENTDEGRPSKPNRVMLNGMLWKVKTGAPWRDLPERFGPWETVYSRFRSVTMDVYSHFVKSAEKETANIIGNFIQTATAKAKAKQKKQAN